VKQKELIWSKRKPTKAGWYWHLTEDGSGIGYVSDDGFGDLRINTPFGADRIKDLDMDFFAGPISEPKIPIPVTDINS